MQGVGVRQTPRAAVFMSTYKQGKKITPTVHLLCAMCPALMSAHPSFVKAGATSALLTSVSSATQSWAGGSWSVSTYPLSPLPWPLLITDLTA